MVHPPLGMRERRVLECLRSINQKTLNEITAEYNQRYPPSWINKTLGIKVGKEGIRLALMGLIDRDAVSRQLLSYYDRPLRVPTYFYCLTPKGIQELNMRT
ncbi:MAG: hypothetical protein WAW13_02135 [Minisyncoccia bacterium]